MSMRVIPLTLAAPTGCCALTIGDGGFAVTGTLPPSAGTCDVHLRTDGDEELPFTRQNITSAFRAYFMVAPCVATYVVVACDGAPKYRAVVRYGKQVRPGQI